MPEAEASCAFCGKSRRQVRDLIARQKLSNANICDQCLSTYRDILDSPPPLEGGVYSVRTGSVTRKLRCSFCQRPMHEVQKLIQSPREISQESICDRCVARSLQILKEFDQPRSAPSIHLRRIGQFFTRQPARLHRLP